MSSALLSNVLKLGLSLLNAANWKGLTTGAINAASGTLVCSDGAFVASDVGKSILIDGAGVGGTIYSGAISAYTSATQVTVTPVVSVTVAGASVSYGGRLADARRNLFEAKETAFEVDEEVYLTIAETVGHWARPDILVWSTPLVYGDAPDLIAPAAPFHIGDLGQTLIQVYSGGPFVAGKPAEFEEIQRYRNNTGTSPLDTYGTLAHNATGSQIGGYFRISEDGEYCAFTGNAMKLSYVSPYERDVDLQSPGIFTGGLVSGFLSRLMAKEGSTLPLVQIHSGFYQTFIGAIRSKMKPLPTLEQFEEKRAA